MRLDGRRSVVVGVGSRIGEACVRSLCQEGADVLAVDPDPAVADTVCATVSPGRGRAHPLDGGEWSEDAAARVGAQCEQRWSQLDVLVVCSAAMDHWPVEDDSPERWDEVLRTNLLGPMAYTRALTPLLRRSEHASVVYLGSIDGLRGNSNVPAYSVSKGGLVVLTHVMAQQLGPDAIRVNCVASAGIVQTRIDAPPVQRTLSDGDLLARLTPLRRRPEPEEIASVVVFYASDDASYVTGTVLPVDGGRIAVTPGAV